MTDSLKKVRDASGQIDTLMKTLDCRAGRLLLQGDYFLCVKDDESYFLEVYELIRANGEVKGSWGASDEVKYQVYRDKVARIDKHSGGS